MNSRIRRLPPAVIEVVSAAACVPSYEAAVAQLVQHAVLSGASRVEVTTAPAALRLTVVDNAPVSDNPPTFAALSGVASVEVVWRTQGEVRNRAVRAGKHLEAVDATSNATMFLPPGTSDATVVDVWELFHNLPVRRRAVSAMQPEELLQLVRDAVGRIALANPSVSIRVKSQNCSDVLQSRPSKELSLDSISSILGKCIADEFIPLSSSHVTYPFSGSSKHSLQFTGFLAKFGLSPSLDCQHVSLNSFPLASSSSLHKYIRQSWRRHFVRAKLVLETDIYGHSPNKKSSNRTRPAFVVNFFSDACNFDFLTLENGMDARFHELDSVQAVIDKSVAQALLRGTTNEFLSSAARLKLYHPTRFPQISPDPRAGNCARRPRSAPNQFGSTPQPLKRRRMPIENLGRESDIEEALAACIPVLKFGDNAVRMQEDVLELEQTLSQSITERALSRPKSRMRRPSSAAQVSEAFSVVSPSWSNPCFPSQGTFLRSGAGSLAAHSNSLSQTLALDLQKVSIPRDVISKLRVIGQADRKFILVVDAFLVVYAVDQHAASERSRFEKLQRCVAGNSESCVPVPVANKTIVTLTPKQASMVRIHGNLLRRWGWYLAVDLTSHEHSRCEIRTTPYLAVAKAFLESSVYLLTYLDSMANGASVHAIPRPILDVLATNACHSAVRFGDTLSRKQCQLLIRSLSECDTPFICAHGRPSIVPLVSL